METPQNDATLQDRSNATLLQEPGGKPSFSRVISFTMIIVVLVGWALDGFGVRGFELPAISEKILAYGVGLTYGINKLAAMVAALAAAKGKT